MCYQVAKLGELLAEIALNTRTLFTGLAIETRAMLEMSTSVANSDWLQSHLKTERNIRGLMEAALLFRKHTLKRSGADDAQAALLAESAKSAP